MTSLSRALTIRLTLLGTVLFVAFIAAVLGGIGSIPGAMLGGLLIGFTEAGASYFFSTYRDAVVFSVLVLVLLVRPAGILGRGMVEKV